MKPTSYVQLCAAWYEGEVFANLPDLDESPLSRADMDSHVWYFQHGVWS